MQKALFTILIITFLPSSKLTLQAQDCQQKSECYQQSNANECCCQSSPCCQQSSQLRYLPDYDFRCTRFHNFSKKPSDAIVNFSMFTWGIGLAVGIALLSTMTHQSKSHPSKKIQPFTTTPSYRLAPSTTNSRHPQSAMVKSSFSRGNP